MVKTKKYGNRTILDREILLDMWVWVGETVRERRKNVGGKITMTTRLRNYFKEEYISLCVSRYLKWVK